MVWGAAQQELGDEDWSARVRECLTRGGCDPDLAGRVADASRYRQADLTDRDQLAALVQDLPDKDRSVLYCALPPPVTARVCEGLAHLDLGGLRLALEKPFGHDLASARELNELLASFRSEDQIFRVDHFLGEAQVLNLLGLRFANQFFEAVWSTQYVERVEIVVDETLGLEGRAGYYDGAGALIDMLQSHLLLMMAMVAMEEPARIDAVELRDLLAHALRATRLAGHASTASRRARYTAGRVGERELPSYVDEPGVDADRGTETLAELDLLIDNRRWAGVPFLLRSGKALAADRKQIVVTFRPVPFIPEGLGGTAPPNRLILDLSPERLDLRIATNGGVNPLALGEARMSAHIGESQVRPYGEILAGILDGNPLLSVRADVVEECWRICDPVVAAWRAGEVPLEEYPAGSEGPQGWGDPASGRH